MREEAERVDSAATDDAVSIGSGVRRVRHVPRIIAFVAVVLVLLTGAFIAGSLIRSPDDVALSNADHTIPVYAAVEKRSVDDGFTIAGAVQAPSTAKILVSEASEEASSVAPTSGDAAKPGDEGAAASSRSNAAASAATAETTTTGRIVVSAAGAKVGDELTPGALLAEVSGRPLFAWASQAPVYRDLVVGSTGSDVRGVQQVLVDAGFSPGSVDGSFGASTLDALRRLYSRAGYKLPYVSDGVQGFAWREAATLPADRVKVTGAAATGTVLDADHPVVDVQTSTSMISAVVTVADADSLAPGSTVTVVAGGKDQAEAPVLTRGAFATDEKSGQSGYPITVELPSALSALTSGDVVTLRPATVPEATLAVPATAIRQDASSTYVLVKRSGSSRDSSSASASPGAANGRKVRVEAKTQTSGWVSIGNNDELAVGDRVLVSGG